ncbi:MAG: hypothetical protein KatS3mg087_1173 [Patescibacteria group bacterium]|nr:MAG: hypothetical protein KatS3mg087_1173 [Patescibacteria group bacterium]
MLTKTDLSWAYGVICHPDRRNTHLPRTLRSLATAGFDNPVLFVDGFCEIPTKLQCSFRHKHVGLFANFSLALAELFVSYPNCDRYALFQDDIICVKGLRAYLNETTKHSMAYWNLYTWPCNVREEPGWALSDQMGRGALGLVFDREGLLALIGSGNFWRHRLNTHTGWKSDDKAVIETLRAIGYKEYVHNPSLLQHTGVEKSLAKNVLGCLESPVFPGEDFNVYEHFCK